MMTMLQWFFGPEYPWFRAARLNVKAKFDVLRKNGKYPKLPAHEVAQAVSTRDEREFSCFWTMFRALHCQALQNIYQRMAFGGDQQLVFRGLQHHSTEQLDEHLGRLILNGFSEPESFSTSIHIAQTFMHGNAYLCLDCKRINMRPMALHS